MEQRYPEGIFGGRLYQDSLPLASCQTSSRSSRAQAMTGTKGQLGHHVETQICHGDRSCAHLGPHFSQYCC